MDTFPLSTPPQRGFRPATAFAGLFFLCGIGFMVITELFDPMQAPGGLLTPPGRDVLGGVMLGVLAFLLLYRRLRTPSEVAPIAFDAHGGVMLPLHGNSAKAVRVELADLTTAHVRGGLLVVGTARRHFVYRADRFLDPDGALRFLEELRRRFLLLPDAEERIAQMRRQAEVGRDVARGKSHATYAIVALLVLGFAIENATHALDQELGLIRLGANAPALVREGQLYRLSAANFLHGGNIHLYVNLMSLLSIGGVVERVLGPWYFIVIYLSAAFGGSAASAALGRSALSVGASTAIFGLLGALAVLNWRFRRELPPGIAQSRRWWITTLGLNMALSIFVPFIDLGAHAGGLGAGALVTWLLVRRMDSVRVGAPAPRPVVVAATALMGLAGLGLVATAVHALDGRVDHSAEATRAVVRWRGASARVLNDVAWTAATRPGASSEVLGLAREAAERAIQLAPARSELHDTLATVEHRLGRDGEAIRGERRALALGESPIYWSQLARFLVAEQAARTPASTPLVLGADRVEIPELEIEGSCLVVRLWNPLPRAASVLAHVFDERGSRVGLLELPVPGDLSGELRFDVLPLSTLGLDAADTRVEPALVNLEPQGRAPRFAYHALLPGVMALP